MKPVFMRWLPVASGLAVLLAVGWVQAAKVSDVRATRHNLSAAADGTTTPSGTVPTRNLKATSETQVCVFCHTPHAAQDIPKSGSTPGAPLWNRQLSSATYTPYASTSIEASAAELAASPGGSSKLCLSCHDGTMAIDKVNVLNGVSSPTIAMNVTTPVNMPAGSGVTTGFTRNLGANLTNDHPISFTYNTALATADGELRAPAAENTVGGVVMNRAIGKAKPVLPLENNQMQCATCHDPHLNDTLDSEAKFLRVNRLQASQPVGSTFSQTNDTICLACHDKGGLSWAYSAHANSNVATQTYKDAAATLREFPTNTPVWKAACLNCHDAHTVQGARRLLREGTDNTLTPKAGGSAAMEETCYQCHTTSAASIVNFTENTANAVPDIKTDFTTAGNKRMPITSAAQPAGVEVHEIGGVFDDGMNANCNNTTQLGNCGKDLLESRVKLGLTNLNNRHAECSDCHNPHRVVKFRDFRGNPVGSISGTPDAAGTHPHTDNNAAIHTNIASGVLRGSWGVEPQYSSPSFHSMPSSFDVKRGDPGASINTAAAATFVTREYQICLKCHSNYGYSDDNVYPDSSSRPQLGGDGLTPVSRTSDGRTHTSYTNQAKEFQAPSTHAVSVGSVSLGTEGGAGASYNINNHRSWHPVQAPTGRLNRAGAFLAPWNNSGTGGLAGRLGVQTMYCSDCHGSNTADNSAIPAGGDNGAPWGPHGSANDFLLKGIWNQTSGEGGTNTLCFKCHNSANYGGTSGGTGWNTDKGDGHNVHSTKIDTEMKCNFCHVAVPHGWKNRGLLVNLNDVGPEVGLAAGTNVGTGPYTRGPYYRRAYLKITSFPSGGTWNESQCNGGRDGMRSQCQNAT